MTGIEYAQVDLMAYVQQKYQKAVWGAVEQILRNHIDNPIMGELTREKIKAAGIRSVFFLKEPPNLEFEKCDEKEVSYKLTSNLIGVAQGHWMISYDGTRRPLTDKEEKYLAAQEQQECIMEYASEKYACRFSSSKYWHDKVKDVNDMVDEPSCDDLEEEIHNKVMELRTTPCYDELASFARHFVNWQKEQFEKERLKHCDKLTDEQAQIESDFVTRHIQENNRTPTFIDAIEYGMRLQKEQMMTYAVDGAFIRRNRYTKKKVLQGLDTTCDAIQSFKDKDKIKVLFIKEDSR